MDFSTEELIQQLKNYQLVHNKPPTIPSTVTAEEIVAHYTVFQRRFGSWINALRAANLSIEDHSSKLYYCITCNEEIIIHKNVEKRSITKRFFCSQSCAATYNNTGKIHSEISKQKRRETLRSKPKQFPLSLRQQKLLQPKWTDNIVGPYTRVYLNKCKKTGQLFYWKSKKPISPYIQNDYNEYRRQCQFNFGISSFPDWFVNVTEMIIEYGWYSPGNSKNPNLNGISRDHLISINYGWLHNIPSWKIRHPANLQLLPHQRNQRKNRKCDISEIELDNRIQQFENQYSYVR